MPPLVPINQQYPPAEPAAATATVAAATPAVATTGSSSSEQQQQPTLPMKHDDDDEDDDDEDDEEEEEEEDEEDEEDDEDEEDEEDEDEDLEYGPTVPAPPPPPPPPTQSSTHHPLSTKPRRKIYAKNFSQLQLVIEVLTHQCGTTEGLDNVTKLIVNLTQCSQASNAIFIQYLTAAILGLAEEVRQAIQALLNEIREYNLLGQQPTAAGAAPAVAGATTTTSSAAAATPSTSAAAAAAAVASTSTAGASLLSHLTVHEGQMQDRFTAESVIISAPKNAKPTCELQLPSMKKLMSNTSAQPYFLRTLKIFMQVRDMYEMQISQNEDNNDDIIDVAALSVPAGNGSSSNSMETGDAPNANVGTSTTSNINAKTAAKPTLSQILCLDVLWHTLSECLVALEESKDEFAVLVLQPTVEAFFLIHASHRVTPKKPGRGSAGAGGGYHASSRRGSGGAAGQATSSAEHSPQQDDTNSSTSSQAPISFDGKTLGNIS